MNLQLLTVGSLFLLAGCVATPQGPGMEHHGLRNFCLATACNTLENSGKHYQRRQQGDFQDE